MKIKELPIGPGTPVPLLRAQIISIKPVLHGNTGDLREAIIEDETGKCTLTFWHEQCTKYSNTDSPPTEGDVVVVQSGWCREYPTGSGNVNVSSGKHGKITKEE